MSGKLWSDPEKDWLKKKVNDEKIHPLDLEKTFQEKFGFFRSKDGCYRQAKNMGLDYLSCSTERTKAQIAKRCVTIPDDPQDEFGNQLKKFILQNRKTYTFRFLSEKFDRSEQTIREHLQKLSLEGFAIEIDEDSSRVMSPLRPSASNEEHDLCDWKTLTHRWGILGDTEIGCWKYQHHYVTKAYKWFAKEDVSIILHTGDLVMGSDKMHPGFEYELSLPGLDEQEDWVVENYPKAVTKGKRTIPTFIISGNHDHSWWKHAGTNIVDRICQRREDMKYLGRTGAYVRGPDGDPHFAYLFHPTDGTAYALSYKDQKSSEILYPGQRPQLHFTGHYHKWNWCEIGGTHFFQTMCMNGQTDWMKSKRIQAIVGAMIVEFNISKTGRVNRVKVERLCFDKILPMDYGKRREPR